MGSAESVLSNRGLGIKAKKCLYEGVFEKVEVFDEMKCLRSSVEVSRMDRVRNEEVRRRAGIE